jgi:hypothetical protein
MASVKTRLIPGKKRAPQLLADSTLMRCAFDRLAQSMLSPATAPSLDFRQSLRTELVAQAVLRAAAVRPPVRGPKARKPKGGFRLAALGIGISAAGGGFALAANRVSPPELPQAPAVHTAAPGLHSGAVTPSTAGYSQAPGVVAPRATAGLPQATAGHSLSSAPAASIRRSTPQLSLPASDAPLPTATARVVAGALSSAAGPAPTLPSPRPLPDVSPLLSSAGAHWVWPTLPPAHRP